MSKSDPPSLAEEAEVKVTENQYRGLSILIAIAAFTVGSSLAAYYFYQERQLGNEVRSYTAG